jgi:hypothetical protein
MSHLFYRKLTAIALTSLLSLPLSLHAQNTAPEILARNTHDFSMSGGVLSGAGIDLIDYRAASAQFVLLGEDHHDALTPIFASALFTRLHARAEIDYAAVEIDPMATETIDRNVGLDDLQHIAQVARAYPTLIGFASDQDLQFLADVRRTAGSKALWAIEQAQDPVRYLEELERLATEKRARSMVVAMLAEARSKASRELYAPILSQEAGALARFTALRDAFAAKPASRAAVLLERLVESAEIYSYYIRANAGEPVGLFNNTVRESWLKKGFMQNYRRATGATIQPKVMFKFGAYHMYRGRNPVQAYPLGNLAHEFAITNGSQAFGLYVIGFGGYTQWSNAPAWMRPILPATEPDGPALIDLAALRPVASRYTGLLAEDERRKLEDLIHGFDALVLIPGSAKASWTLTGFPQP